MGVRIDNIKRVSSIFALELAGIQFFRGGLSLKLVREIIVFNVFKLSKFHVYVFWDLLKISPFYSKFLTLLGHNLHILVLSKNSVDFLSSSY